MTSAGICSGYDVKVTASLGLSAGLSGSSAMIMASSSGNLSLGLRYKVKRATEVASIAAVVHMATLPVIASVTATPAQAQNHTEHVSRGTSVSDEVVNKGKFQSVYDGGIANSTIINSVGTQYVSDGGTTNGTIVNSDGFQHVSMGGTANNTIINDGGSQYVSEGGIANSTTISAGGTQYVHGHSNGSGGNAQNTTIEAGGSQKITSRGNATSSIVKDGGYQNLAWGSSFDTVVSAGGSQLVTGEWSHDTTRYGFGRAYGTVVHGGGVQEIRDSGYASRTTVQTDGKQIINSLGRAFDTTIYGVQNVSGGSASGNTIYGVQNVSGGSAVRNTIHGSQNVVGGSATNNTIEDGGYQLVSRTTDPSGTQVARGSALETTVSNGGTQEIDGGYASRTTVQTGGMQIVSSGGSAFGNTIYGSQNVVGGSASGNTIGDKGKQTITSDGFVTSTTIEDGGHQSVAWGTATNNTIEGGGYQLVSRTTDPSGTPVAWGSASGTTVNNGGTQEIDGGYASRTTVQTGGMQIVSSGGSAFGNTIYGSQNVVGGSASGNTIGDKGKQTITSDGFVTSTTIEDGGHQSVAWGTATGTTIEQGGYQLVSRTLDTTGTQLGEGSALGTTVHDGGRQELLDGYASGTTVQTDGMQIVNSGGVAENNEIFGTQEIAAYGSALNNTIRGLQSIRNGGLVWGVLAHAGGIVDVEQGGVITGSATFTTGSTLRGNATIRDGGTLTFEDGSTLEIRIREPAAGSDKITVTGNSTVTINSGANLNLVQDGAIPLWTTGKSYTIIVSNSTINGQFGTIDYGGIPISPFAEIFQEKRANATGEELVLIARYNPDNPVVENGTDNQKAANTGINGLPDGHAVKDALVNAQGADPALNLLDQLSGEAHKSISNALASHFRMRNMDTLFHVSWAKVRSRGVSAQFASTVDTPLTPSSRGNGLWADVSGAYSSIDGNSSPVGTAKTELYGPEVSIGYDYRSPDGWIVGGSFRYGDLTGKVDGRRSEADIDSYNALIYGGKEFSFEHGVMRLALGGAYGYDRVDMNRTISAATFSDTLNTSYDAHSYQVFGEAAYAFSISSLFITEPFVNVSWDSRFNDSFCENGGPAALCSESDTQNTVTSVLGVRGFVPAHERVSVAYELGWVHTYGSLNDTWNMGFRDGASNYDIRGAAGSRDAFKAKLGVGLKLTDDLQGDLVYNGVIGGDSSSHGGTFRLTWSW